MTDLANNESPSTDDLEAMMTKPVPTVEEATATVPMPPFALPDSWDDNVAQDVSDRAAKALKAGTAGLLEMDDVVRLILTSFFNRSHILKVGPPGEAKSLTARTVTEMVEGAEFFDRQLDMLMVKDDIFGPLDGLEYRHSGDKVHKLKGFLIPAHLGLLDEIDKAGKNRNYLLQLMAEGMFDNGATKVRSRVRTLIGTANYGLQDTPAINDRFLIRLLIEPPTRDASLDALFGDELSTPVHQPITLGELEWYDMVRGHIKTSDKAKRQFRRFHAELRAEGIHLSSRRTRWMGRWLKTVAFLNGDDTVEPKHLLHLRNCITSDFAQMDVVDKALEAFASGTDKEVKAYREKLSTLNGRRDDLIREKAKPGSPPMVAEGLTLFGEYGKLKNEILERSTALAGEGEDTDGLAALVEELRSDGNVCKSNLMSIEQL